ncbi:MAG: site-specific integrase [Ethanoligenens sp.]
MAICTREVKNKRDSKGKLTGRSGTVYDVAIKYKTANGYKSYMKRGFPTHQEAAVFEAEMKVKLAGHTSIIKTLSAQNKQTLKEFLLTWIDKYGNANLRPSTLAGYTSNIKNHINPNIGHHRLKDVTPELLDNLYGKLFNEGLSNSSVRYCHRILSVAFESAKKYKYIESNPAHDVITKFSASAKTPDPYTVQQMQVLMANILGTEWEMIVALGGLYGLRISEVIGLRWKNVDLENKTFRVREQLPFNLPPGTVKLPDELAPVKSKERKLPITDVALPFFLRQQKLQIQQKELASLAGNKYYDNRLVVAKANGSPYKRDSVSERFGTLLKRLNLPHIRFHDLRHTAATNMHQLTGDFYTVGEILGHSLKAMGNELGMTANFDTVTARYVDVRMERKQAVLDTYHKAVYAGPVRPQKRAEMER